MGTALQLSMSCPGDKTKGIVEQMKAWFSLPSMCLGAYMGRIRHCLELFEDTAKHMALLGHSRPIIILDNIKVLIFNENGLYISKSPLFYCKNSQKQWQTMGC